MDFIGHCSKCGQKIGQGGDESRASRGFLEGAVIPAYCEWQYNIPAKAKGYDDARRYIFKKDFNYEIVKSRLGTPQRIPLSTRGQAKVVLDKFTRYAQENGCPVPNVELYKLYKNNWSMDKRFPTFHHFLEFLDLQVDAMPSDQTLKVLDIKKIEYPKYNDEPNFG